MGDDGKVLWWRWWWWMKLLRWWMKFSERRNERTMEAVLLDGKEMESGSSL